MFNFIRKLFKKNDGLVETLGVGEGDEKIKEVTDLSDSIEDGAVEAPVPETSAKVMPSTKGLICINNGEKNRYIHPEDPIPEGWVLGGKKKIKKQ